MLILKPCIIQLVLHIVVIEEIPSFIVKHFECREMPYINVTTTLLFIFVCLNTNTVSS